MSETTIKRLGGVFVLVCMVVGFYVSHQNRDPVIVPVGGGKGGGVPVPTRPAIICDGGIGPRGQAPIPVPSVAPIPAMHAAMRLSDGEQ